MKTLIKQLRLICSGPGIAMSLAAFGLVSTASAQSFEMMTHENDVPGVREVEAGNYDKAIRLLTVRLGDENQAWSLRVPLLINLCVAHTMKGEYEVATGYCDRAVESNRDTGLALNNRGALRIARGQYEAAIDDFAASTRHSGARRLARRNLNRAEVRIAEIGAKRQETQVASTESPNRSKQ